MIVPCTQCHEVWDVDHAHSQPGLFKTDGLMVISECPACRENIGLDETLLGSFELDVDADVQDFQLLVTDEKREYIQRRESE